MRLHHGTPACATEQDFISKKQKQKQKRLGKVAQACNPSTLGGQGRWITRSRYRHHLGQHGETLSLLQIQKISWVWWCVPVIPATWEAEAGGSLESRKWRLQGCSEPRSRYCTPAWATRAKLCRKKGKERKEEKRKQGRTEKKEKRKEKQIYSLLINSYGVF